MTGPVVLAADIGGTQMRAALVDPDGRLLVRRSAQTPGQADVPAALIDLIRTVGAERSAGTASYAVVGLPGAVDYEAAQLLWAPHLPPAWQELLCGEELSARLGMPALLANDADLAAVGEAMFGAGAGEADVAYLTISTGVGAGVLSGGRLVRGRRSVAEVGHTVIDWVAWRQGLPGTLEELGSGSGLARRAHEAGLGALDAKGVADEAAAGNVDALDIWQGAIAACAAGVANLVLSFSPSTVVIGGGLGRRDDFFGPVRDLVMSRLENHPAKLSVVPSALGDDAALAGAARWEAVVGEA
jgi:glucokinase